MPKLLFIQGIHNFALTERFIDDVSQGTGLEVVTFQTDYGLVETEKQRELIATIEAHLTGSDDRFIILAHSFGGILAYCLSDAAYANVDKIITFATPHQVPFRWFTNILKKLPYRPIVPVEVQTSCGFFFDTTVPFLFTKHQHGTTHRNFVGTHTSVPDRKTFFARLVLDT
ncbi:MAG: hypothetical protein KBD05_03670 [Candidatus Pacebacteria bacterium]|nr:hypothetical protein [Candidatus Paceibacterota bacterium]